MHISTRIIPTKVDVTLEEMPSGSMMIRAQQKTQLTALKEGNKCLVGCRIS